MCAVEQAQLGLFPRGKVRCDLHAGALEIGPGTGEPVLDDPLREGFGSDRCQIDKTQSQFGEFHVRVARSRDDAIDHRLGKCAISLDPIGETQIVPARNMGHAGSQLASVSGNIVARDDRQRRQPAFFPELQACCKITRHCRRR